MEDERKMIVISNRLPVVLEEVEGEWRSRSGTGGLITALSPILRDRGGTWIGWLGMGRELNLSKLRSLMGPVSRKTGYKLVPVVLSEADIENYYYGFSNKILWPLFHDLPANCRFVPEYSDYYVSVNRKFAETLLRYGRKEDYVWVHDYHLIPLARCVREAGSMIKCAFFLHITFPPLDIFLKLPWRKMLLKDFMEYGFIGFQTVRDRRNFIECLKAFDLKARVIGRGPVVEVSAFGRSAKVGSLPISIDFKAFSRMAGSQEVRLLLEKAREDVNAGTVILGVDRLDYTKGLPEKLRAFEMVLRRFPELRERVTLFQLIVPSREDVPEYRKLREEIELLTSRINGEFSTLGWVPVRHQYRTVSREELISLYRLADICLVSSLKDGMNLVCKEYCASHVDNDGVLILSEFAGAASQLGRWAILINPHDITGMAEAIYHAVRMERPERIARMKRMRRSIRRRDVFWWVNNFLRASSGRELQDFPLREWSRYDWT